MPKIVKNNVYFTVCRYVWVEYALPDVSLVFTMADLLRTSHGSIIMIPR